MMCVVVAIRCAAIDDTDIIQTEAQARMVDRGLAAAVLGSVIPWCVEKLQLSFLSGDTFSESTLN